MLISLILFSLSAKLISTYILKYLQMSNLKGQHEPHLQLLKIIQRTLKESFAFLCLDTDATDFHKDVPPLPSTTCYSPTIHEQTPIFFPIFHKNFQVKDRQKFSKFIQIKKEKKLTHSSCFLFFCPYINKNKTLKNYERKKLRIQK